MTEQAERRSEDRRKHDLHSVVELITEVHKDIKDLDKRLATHMTEETLELAEEIARLMTKAFPEGDPDGHRRHHELVIQQAEKRAEFWSKLVFELSRGGLLGFIAWAAYALWKAFLLGPTK